MNVTVWQRIYIPLDKLLALLLNTSIGSSSLYIPRYSGLKQRGYPKVPAGVHQAKDEKGKLQSPNS